jgi:hypothetical protein
MAKFDLHCKWDIDGVDLYVDSGKGSEKVGRIPKNVRQATLNAIAPRLSDGKDVRLFRYVLVPNFEKQSINVRLFDGEMQVIEYEIVVDAKDATLVKEI